MELVQLACRSVLVVVFAVAVVGKVSGRSAFDGFVTSLTPLVARPVARLVAVPVVVAESLAVAMLLVRASTGLLVAAVVLTVLTVPLVAALLRRTTVVCRCFGGREGQVGWAHVGRNVGFVAVAAVGLAAGAVPATPVPAAGAAIAVVGGALLALVAMYAADVRFLFARDPYAGRAATRVRNPWHS